MQVEAVVVAEDFLACVLELHFDELCAVGCLGQAGEVVVYVELLVLPAAAFGAEAAQSVGGREFLHSGLGVYVVVVGLVFFLVV